MIKTELNLGDFKNSVEVSYPYFLIDEPQPTIPVILQNVREGDIPVHLQYKGRETVVAHMSKSAYNIQKVLRGSGPIKIVMSAERVVEIKTIEQYLEVCIEWT